LRRNTALALVAGGIFAGSRALEVQAQELPLVRIGTNAIDALGEAYYGTESGIFRNAGLNAVVTTTPNGSTTAQAVIAGDLDVGLANIVTVAAGVAHGIPLQMLAPAALYSTKHAYSALCCAKASPLASAKDLIGQTCAVSTLNDFNQLGIEAWLEKNGVAVSKVKFVELKFAEMGAALARGTVAAATISEPALTASLNTGQARIFADVYTAIAPEFANIVWFTTKGWLQKNPDTAKRLVSGIYATARWANTHLPESAEIIAKIAKIDMPTVTGMRRAFFATGPDPKYVQAPLDFAYRFGLTARPVTTAEFIAQT
jgi:NitT/TauT family transport system substrate-binding protein